MTLLLYIIIDILALFFFYKYVIGKKSLNKINKHNSKIYLIISFVLLASLIVLRSSSVGMDYVSVGNSFKRIATGFETAYDIEWFGYPFFYIIKFLSIIIYDNVFLFYFIIGLLSLFLLYKSILDNGEYKTMSLFLFISFCLYYQFLNQSRQMLAVSIILFSFKFIKDKKIIKYCITILLASAIHNTAIIMLPMYFFTKIKITNKILFLTLIIGVTLFFNTPMLEYIIQKTSYSYYLSTIYNQSFTSSSMMNLVFRIILLLLCLIPYKKVVKKYEYANVLYVMAIFCTFGQIITINFYFMARLTTYFFVFYIFLIPLVIEEFLNKIRINKRKKLFIILFILFFVSYHFIYYFSSSGASGAGYEKYITIFSKE
ncbi:MAG: EpsG family protein [Bacilli bacterium]